MNAFLKKPALYLFLSFSLIFILTSYTPALLHNYFIYGGLLFIAAGLFVCACCINQYFKNQLARHLDDQTGFISEGIYKYTRNPDHLSAVLLLSGTALISLNPLALIIPIVYFQLCNKWFIPNEERRMIRNFGMNYLDFKDRVRRWI